MSRVRESLGEAAFEADKRGGTAMPVSQASNYALAEIAQELTALAASSGPAE